MKLMDSNRFWLPNLEGQYLHLATVHNGVREFVCFAHVPTQQIYIEEITGGQLSFIDDDSLAEGIARFLEDKHITDMTKPLRTDDDWLRQKQNTKHL